MQFSVAEIMGWLGLFVWPWIRVGGMMLTAPLFTQNAIPVRVRVLLGLALTVVLMPAVASVPQVDPLSMEALMIAVQQALIGIALGFLISLPLQAATIGGEAVAMSMGLGFATMADPQGGMSVPVVSQFMLILVTLLFLAVGGHLMFIELMAESFQLLPISAVGFARDDFFTLVSWGSVMFTGAVLIALPALVLLLLVNLAMGVMTRAAPQMNIFSVGFPLTLMLGFLSLLYLVLPSLPGRMYALWRSAFDAARQMLGA
ncbi:flagellar biosynthetic protein FliR [Alkalilimnicola sp. S0819]|uniref:flagellar biosynthetic protein FliR n=1 Tax=Alkalilimnicola sp. S0819 TaxID=2613922 RepID=UPI001262199F|nr:flagellar biosynthetic protein FliR [Alkalilimnicola sp. S0819]KAB7627171.1 flagellar biosynthetic protein FliR [Alkalilimnicola sp. S0819]MPQ15882.1 flagellar biosynthetic protein FliR [Alkalilimnicola sp. S0819]